MRYLPVFVFVVAGALSPVVAFADAPLPAAKPAAPVKVERWADIRVVAELRTRDTAKVDVVTAGEEQKTSYGRCAKAADPTLCKVLVTAVNVAAMIGTNIPTK